MTYQHLQASDDFSVLAVLADPTRRSLLDLLRRKRAGDNSDAINRAISATINGISAGLRNTG